MLHENKAQTWITFWVSFGFAPRHLWDVTPKPQLFHEDFLREETVTRPVFKEQIMKTSIKTVDQHKNLTWTFEQSYILLHWQESKEFNYLFHDTNRLEYLLVFPLKSISLEVYSFLQFLRSPAFASPIKLRSLAW